MRKAEVRIHDQVAGYLIDDEDGYTFTYETSYLDASGAEAISLTLPLQQRSFKSNVLFPFFDWFDINGNFWLHTGYSYLATYYFLSKFKDLLPGIR